MALREILLFVVLRFFQILLILSAMFKGFLGIMFRSDLRKGGIVMAQPSLAALYKRFMKGQDITGMEAQREADIRFLRMAMPGMQYSPLKLAQVLQKYSLNRVISHYGKKLVREVSQQPEYQKRREEMMDRLYPDNIENRFKL